MENMDHGVPVQLNVDLEPKLDHDLVLLVMNVVWVAVDLLQKQDLVEQQLVS